MKNNRIALLMVIIVLLVFSSCTKKETALGILQETIHTIDTIETLYYKQDMSRSNPRSPNDTIFRYREMYFKRLISDSIVGVKGHWYMYGPDNTTVIYEDIYDGNRLIRKNNRDSLARVYDLEKYPDFRKAHFWSHNTLYGLQYEFRHILDHPQSYIVERWKDTLMGSTHCYQIVVSLEDQRTMPGFATQLEDSEGDVSQTSFFIDKQTYYPIGMKGVSYSKAEPEQMMFIDQRYYDIKFNSAIDEVIQFNTTAEFISGYGIEEMKPE